MDAFRVRPASDDAAIFGFRTKQYVQLVGNVLAYEISTPTELTCVYFSKEDVRISHDRRFYGRRLIGGLLTPFLGLLIAVPLGLGVDALIEEEGNELLLGAIALVLAAVLGLSFLIAAIQIVRFFFRRRTTCLNVETVEGDYEFEFWHDAGKNKALDDLIRELENRESSDQETAAPDLVLAHNWAYTRPVRTAMMAMLVTFFCVWFVLKAIEFAFRSQGNEGAPTGFALLFAAIPLAGLASYLTSGYRLARAEPGHKTALMHFINRDYDMARKDIEHILDAQPDDPDALMLGVHTHIRLGNLDGIAPLCRKIDELEPDVGSDIFLRIMKLWELDSNSTIDRVRNEPEDT